MPAALIPAAISVATSVAGGAGIATAIAYGGINAVLSLALSSSRRQPTAYTPSSNPVGRKHILRSTEAPHEIVYGRVRKSGLLTFAYSTGREGNLHLVLTFAAHECDAIEQLWLDEERSTHKKYQHHVQFTAHRGRERQQADNELARTAPAWNATHRGQNIAYAHVKLRWDENLWNLGLPDISATVRGKKLYDPRIAEVLEGESVIHPLDDSQAYLFSDNPAAAAEQLFYDFDRRLVERDHSVAAVSLFFFDELLADVGGLCKALPVDFMRVALQPVGTYQVVENAQGGVVAE